MEYSTELANIIADRHNIGTETMNTWRKRGKIPDKYFRENFRPAEQTEEYVRLNRRVCNIMILPAINRQAEEIVQHLTFKTKVQDVLTGKGVFSFTELVELELLIDQNVRFLTELVFRKQELNFEDIEAMKMWQISVIDLLRGPQSIFKYSIVLKYSDSTEYLQTMIDIVRMKRNLTDNEEVIKLFEKSLRKLATIMMK